MSTSMSIDMTNAFNSIHQAAMFAAADAGSTADGAGGTRGRDAPAHCRGPKGYSSRHVTA